jgi:hypothetical protein
MKKIKEKSINKKNLVEFSRSVMSFSSTSLQQGQTTPQDSAKLSESSLGATSNSSQIAVAATTSTAPQSILLRVSIPSAGVQKTLRVNLSDMVWSLKRQIMDKVAADIKDAMNHGFFLAASGGKLGKFLDEKRDIADYKFENQVSHIKPPCIFVIIFLFYDRP